jgi:hypothetical protein
MWGAIYEQEKYKHPYGWLYSAARAHEKILRPCTSYWSLLPGDIQIVPCRCDHFLICCAPHLSSNHLWFIHQSSLVWLQQWHLVAMQGESMQEMAVKFCLSIPVPYLKGSFNMPQNLTAWGWWLYILLWIFITLKNPLLLARFHPENLGSNSKHDDRYTTKND